VKECIYKLELANIQMDFMGHTDFHDYFLKKFVKCTNLKKRIKELRYGEILLKTSKNRTFLREYFLLKV
jgi:hypothetical protein